MLLFSYTVIHDWLDLQALEILDRIEIRYRAERYIANRGERVTRAIEVSLESEFANLVMITYSASIERTTYVAKGSTKKGPIKAGKHRKDPRVERVMMRRRYLRLSRSIKTRRRPEKENA